ncbi:hypothetical protein GCM10010218_23070 [Streptomyces mashuensis]|uniref:Transferase n=1 Tax=Streptomyces mashuensis TaxID=33904 RepID=A0A919B1A8_9ACTN|nr:hypothetical protein [Streptomyces mashuensis]GHF41035.1 hypothetical protein GCM10010218_23070 [Streptomyces mashuensis]
MTPPHPDENAPSTPEGAPPTTTTTEESTIVSAPPLAFDAGTPSADCIADSAGGLTFDLDAPGPAEGDAPWSAALVLRRRGTEEAGEAEEVRLPLAPGAAGRLRAVLPSTVSLPEGRWDVHVAFGEDEPRRLVPGLADLRSLVDRRPGPSTSPLAVRIPYGTKHGNLSLRSWQRAPHAEAGDLTLDAVGITVRGTLYRVEDPAAWLAGAVAEARSRRDASVVRTAEVTADGQDFVFTLSWAALCEEWRGGPEVWDLWLRGPEGADPVRIARLLDDVADKKQVFTYPAQPVDAAYAPAQAGPYYTADNDLSVRVDERA